MAKILVVDDDPRNLRLAVSVLKQAGKPAAPPAKDEGVTTKEKG